MKNYVFQIGFNKTGTTSLCKALNKLGYNASHYRTTEAVARAMDEGKPPLTYAGKFNAFTDNLPVMRNYALLDKYYPGSKFILLIRNVKDWLKSQEKHALINYEKAKNGMYNYERLANIDLKGWEEDWHFYHKSVKEYFADKDNLLIMDICSGDGYEKLCPFLNKPIPKTPFPIENKTTKNKVAPLEAHLIFSPNLPFV